MSWCPTTTDLRIILLLCFNIKIKPQIKFLSTYSHEAIKWLMYTTYAFITRKSKLGKTFILMWNTFASSVFAAQTLRIIRSFVLKEFEPKKHKQQRFRCKCAFSKKYPLTICAWSIPLDLSLAYVSAEISLRVPAKWLSFCGHQYTQTHH